MQLELYAHRGNNESHDKKIFRLSYKWLIESELWMICIIIFELAAVSCLSRIGDKKHKCIAELDKLGYDQERISFIENNY
jgi:hypothetical protein